MSRLATIEMWGLLKEIGFQPLGQESPSMKGNVTFIDFSVINGWGMTEIPSSIKICEEENPQDPSLEGFFLLPNVHYG